MEAALKSGSVPTVVQLVKGNPDLVSHTIEGGTPIELAASYGQHAIVCYLGS